MNETPIATFATQTEAMLWAEVLQGEGIPCVLVPLDPGAGGWGSSVWVAHEIRVRPADSERARQVLAAYRDPEDQRPAGRRRGWKRPPTRHPAREAGGDEQ